MSEKCGLGEQGYRQELLDLKSNGFEPRVIYDIGAGLLHFTNQAKTLWPLATYVLFDASFLMECLYKKFEGNYHIGALSDTERVITFVSNKSYCERSSKYKNTDTLSQSEQAHARTLDSVVAERQFPLPDLIHIDLGGAEADTIRGAGRTLSHAAHLIVDTQRSSLKDCFQGCVPLLTPGTGLSSVFKAVASLPGEWLHASLSSHIMGFFNKDASVSVNHNLPPAPPMAPVLQQLNQNRGQLLNIVIYMAFAEGKKLRTHDPSYANMHNLGGFFLLRMYDNISHLMTLLLLM